MLDPDERIVKVLSDNGYKATPQRLCVARRVFEGNDHPSAQTICEDVMRVHPTISLSTVYNTLTLPWRLNLVHETLGPDSGRQFDSNMRPHINLVCTMCGDILDVDEPLMEDALIRLQMITGFTRTGQCIDVHGLCSRCARGQNR